MGKFQDIVKVATPDGWTVIQTPPKDKRFVALCIYHGRTIYVPKVNCARHLQYFFHEVAHATLHGGKSQAKHVEEFEAEMWSFAQMVAHGVPIGREMLRAAQMNVLDKIFRDKKQKLEIDPRADAWVQRGNLA